MHAFSQDIDFLSCGDYATILEGSGERNPRASWTVEGAEYYRKMTEKE